MSAGAITLLDEHYPDSDGKPLAETGIHVECLLSLFGRLLQVFRPFDDVYLAANMFLYYVEGNPKKRWSPDIMVNKGVKNGKVHRRSFKTWVEKVTPACVIEVTSKETAKEDLKFKKSLYKKLNVREYFLFDPLEEYLPKQFIGYHLLGKKYESMERADDGSIFSEEIGLRLLPDGENLQLINPITGQHVLYGNELYDKFDEAFQQLDETSQQLNETSHQLDEKSRRLEESLRQLEAERQRVAEMEAELARLKASR